MNPLLALKQLGQSIWLDYIERGLLDDGGLAKLIGEDGVTGVTSNPSIFHQAITRTGQYDGAIAELADAGASTDETYFRLVIDDIRGAADVLAPVYDASDGADGYVSLEVSPHLANDTAESIEQAHWLWKQVDRPNLMIKIPGTLAGLPAITRLIADGINVNVTLLFSVERYRAVAEAWLAGLEARSAAGQPLDVASVASFFLSRIDSAVDEKLPADLQGKTAIAAARDAYRVYEAMIADSRWQALAQAGARPQRLLWASTSTKNPDYSDVMYVDELIGAETVNTLPPKTLEAYRDRGEPAVRIRDGKAAEVLDSVARSGVDLEETALQLEEEGVDKFIKSFDALMEALDGERQRLKSA